MLNCALSFYNQRLLYLGENALKALHQIRKQIAKIARGGCAVASRLNTFNKQTGLIVHLKKAALEKEYTNEIETRKRE